MKTIIIASLAAFVGAVSAYFFTSVLGVDGSAAIAGGAGGAVGAVVGGILSRKR